MGWLAAVVAIIAVVWFAILYPGFRKFLGLLVLGAVGLAFALYLYSDWDRRENEKQKLLARSRIAISAVDLQNFTISHDFGSSWTVKGFVKNNSASTTLKELSLTVSITDCDLNGKNCIVVGMNDRVGNYHTLDIPPGQARAFNAYAHFDNLPQLRNWSWSFRINYIEAAR